MIKFVIVGVLLGLLLAVVGVRLARRMSNRAWRPGAGMLALACILSGVFLLTVVKIPPLGALLLTLGLIIAMSVRRVRAPPHETDASSAPPLRRRVGMSVEEARAILGVGPEASAEEVQSAYLRLIRRAHPDQGGTSGLAAQLNTARDTLLGKK